MNKFTGGIERVFAPIRSQDADNPFLISLLHHNVRLFEQVSQLSPDNWNIDVHFVRVTGDLDEAGLPSPEGPHRDGFDYIALHHIKRNNILGGVTTIYDPEGGFLEEFEMRHPLDTLYAQDNRILHHVSPIHGACGQGYRDVLLTSYNLS